MQNKYVSELADFAKYGLLRALCSPKPNDGHSPLGLGVVWYLNQDDEKKLQPRGYLMGKPEYRDCDRELYDGLREIWCSNRLRVTSIEKEELLPAGTVYHKKLLPTDGDERAKWVRQATRKINEAECGVVFVDPDNGVLPSGTKEPSAKHVTLEELACYAGGDQRSLVIYQHHNRGAAIAGQVYDWQARLCHIGPSFALVSTVAQVSLFVIPIERDRELLLARAEAMLDGPWAQHFMMARSRKCC